MDPADWPPAAALGFLGLLSGFRGARGSVTLDPEAVTVRGLMWSRTIPREAITLMDEDGVFAPTIEWTSARGTKRLTPLMFLVDTSKGWGPIGEHNRQCIRQLAQHLGSRRSRRR